MRIKLLLLVLFPTLFAAQNCFASPSNKSPWQFEIVPYAWLSSIDGDVTVANREVGVDLGFEDLLDATDIGGSLLAITRYERWILWTQVDYFKLDTDELDNAPERARLQNDTFFGTAAFGYQFKTGDSSTLDVLAGVRYLNLENELTIGNVVDAKAENSFLDTIFMLRPNFPLLSWLAFNPTMSVGAGDSDLTYELQPQFHFQITDTLVARLGYRRLYYDVGGDRKGFDGSFHGLIAGLGFQF